MKIILPDYSSPSKKVKGDFFAARPLKQTQSKVNYLVLDYIMDELQPLCIFQKPSFKNLLTDLAPYAKALGRNALAMQTEAKFIEVQKGTAHDFELTNYMSLTTDIWSAISKSYSGMTAHFFNENLK